MAADPWDIQTYVNFDDLDTDMPWFREQAAVLDFNQVGNSDESGSSGGGGIEEAAGPSGLQETGRGFQEAYEIHIPDPSARRRRVILGVTGTPAVADVPYLVRRLALEEVADVWVVCTEDSFRYFTKGPLDIDGARYFTEVHESNTWNVDRTLLHEKLSAWAEVVFVVPASCDIITKVALGFSDNLLTKVVKSFTGPVYLVPDMDPGSYCDNLTTDYVNKIRGKGYVVKDPPLLGNIHHIGRMGPMDEVKDWMITKI